MLLEKSKTKFKRMAFICELILIKFAPIMISITLPLQNNPYSRNGDALATSVLICLLSMQQQKASETFSGNRLYLTFSSTMITITRWPGSLIDASCKVILFFHTKPCTNYLCKTNAKSSCNFSHRFCHQKLQM